MLYGVAGNAGPELGKKISGSAEPQLGTMIIR
jgi:hypothetical protein